MFFTVAIRQNDGSSIEFAVDRFAKKTAYRLGHDLTNLLKQTNHQSDCNLTNLLQQTDYQPDCDLTNSFKQTAYQTDSESINPPKRTVSLSYATTDCPGATSPLGSSISILTLPSPIAVTVAEVGAA